MRRTQKLGQCFLNSASILNREARWLECTGKTVLEIGGGDGRLTRAVLEQGAARVCSVEKDSRFAQVLRERFANESQVEIIEGDFLELELPATDCVIGNVPYYISAPILFKLATMGWSQGLLMLQKEFVEKMVAKPNESNYGRLSVTAQLHFQMDYKQTVPRSMFSPRPKVDSAIVLLKPKGTKLTQQQEDMIRVLFQHKNQTVRNALQHGKLETGNLDAAWLSRRVRTLKPEECLELARKLPARAAPAPGPL